MAQTLRDRYGNDHPIPRRVLPKWLAWLLAPMVNKSLTRKIVSLNVNVPFNADNSKSIRELEVSYRPLKESMIDMFGQMFGNGAFKS